MVDLESLLKEIKKLHAKAWQNREVLKDMFTRAEFLWIVKEAWHTLEEASD